MAWHCKQVSPPIFTLHGSTFDMLCSNAVSHVFVLLRLKLTFDGLVLIGPLCKWFLLRFYLERLLDATDFHP
jgi:hypothetical protein